MRKIVKLFKFRQLLSLIIVSIVVFTALEIDSFAADGDVYNKTYDFGTVYMIEGIEPRGTTETEVSFDIDFNDSAISDYIATNSLNDADKENFKFRINERVISTENWLGLEENVQFGKTGSAVIYVDVIASILMDYPLMDSPSVTKNVSLEFPGRIVYWEDDGNEAFIENVTYKYTFKAEFLKVALGDGPFVSPSPTPASEPTPTPTPVAKLDGSVKVSASDIYYGETLKVSASSDTNGDARLTYYYKDAGAADSSYTTTAPSAVGSYVVKAVYAENDKYKEAYSTATFNITRMAAPSYSVDGTKGSNDYYISDVTIYPASGYLIASSENGSFAGSIVLSSGNEVSDLYFKKESTGAISAGVNFDPVNIDKLAPAISNVQNNQTIYADEYEIDVMDINLAKVTLNGENVALVGGRATISLIADYEDIYTIVATDKAGNSKTITFTLSPEWLKDGVIPEGKRIKLKKGTMYTLSEGKWTIEGDSTVYEGGTKITVGQDCELIFHKVQ